jgi:GGDEF domain-containing protein
MMLAVIVAGATLGALLVMLVAKGARMRSNRRFEALLSELDDSLGAITQTFRAAADRSREKRSVDARDREPTPDVEHLLERIVADGAAVRAFKQVAGQVVPSLAQADRSYESQSYGYEAELERKVSKAQRSGRPLALVLLDLGRSDGAEDDRLPAELAALLGRVTRATDSVCRRRFCEFGVLLPDTTADGARRFHSRVREEVARAGFGETAQAPFAAGIVEWQPNETSHSLDARARAAADRRTLGALESAAGKMQAPHSQRPVL